MKEVYNFLNRDLNIRRHDSLIVAVSGGPDSIALLNLLVEFNKETDIHIICAHVNHNKRKENRDEAKLVRKYCDNHGITFELLEIESYGDDNFHNEARIKRYEFLRELSAKYGARYVFTAHHGDDLIETVLMRISRGSTLKGYAGFNTISKWKDIEIVRPLISVSKETILEYCHKHKLDYVNDPTNVEDMYTRNRYRKRILPFLKHEDENIHLKYLKFSKTLMEYDNYLNNEITKIKKDIYPQNVLNIEMFKTLQRLVQVKFINNILEAIYPEDLVLITDIHTNIIIDLIYSKKANSSIHLPNNIRAIKAYNNLVFIQEDESNVEYEIELDSVINLPNGHNIIKVDEGYKRSNNYLYLSSKEVKLPLFVRNRQDGDKMSLKGMLGRKKVNEIFVDAKIPTKDRNLWPVLVDADNNILWVPGVKKSKFDKQKSEFYDIILKYD